MPRIPRRFRSDQTLHVVRRGNNRCDCFFAPEDHALYLSLLVEFAQDSRCSVHAYAMMSNHVHLLLTSASAEGTSRLMHRLGMVYTKAINRKYQRTGTLWGERFHASAVETDEYVLECHRYIELNPVRARIVDQPDRYRWSSYTANIGIDSAEWMVPHASMLALGRTREDAASRYRGLFAKPIDDLTLAALRAGRLQPPVPRTYHVPEVQRPAGAGIAPGMAPDVN